MIRCVSPVSRFARWSSRCSRPRRSANRPGPAQAWPRISSSSGRSRMGGAGAPSPPSSWRTRMPPGARPRERARPGMPPQAGSTGSSLTGGEREGGAHPAVALFIPHFSQPAGGTDGVAVYRRANALEPSEGVPRKVCLAEQEAPPGLDVSRCAGTAESAAPVRSGTARPSPPHGVRPVFPSASRPRACTLTHEHPAGYTCPSAFSCWGGHS